MREVLGINADFRDVISGKVGVEEWKEKEREDFRRKGLSYKKCEKIFEKYSQPKKGATKLLNEARRRGYVVGILADEPYEHLKSFFRKTFFYPDFYTCLYISYDYSGLFDKIIIPYSFNGLSAKHLALRGIFYKYRPKKIIILGDNYNDIQVFYESKSLYNNVKTIAVNPKVEDLEKVSDHIVYDLLHIIKFL